MAPTPVSERTLRNFTDKLRERIGAIPEIATMARDKHHLSFTMTDAARAKLREAIASVQGEDALEPDAPDAASIKMSIDMWAAQWHAADASGQDAVVNRVMKHLELIVERMVDPYPAYDDVFPHVMAKIMTVGQLTGWNDAASLEGNKSKRPAAPAPNNGRCQIRVPHIHWKSDLAIVACIDSDDQIAVCSADLMKVWGANTDGIMDLGYDNLRRHAEKTPPSEGGFNMKAFLADRVPTSMIDRAKSAFAGFWKKQAPAPDVFRHLQTPDVIPVFIYDKDDGHAASRLLLPDIIMTQVKAVIAERAAVHELDMNIHEMFIPLLALAPDRDTLIIMPLTPATVVIAVEQSMALYQAARYPVSPLPFLIAANEEGEIGVTSFKEIVEKGGWASGDE